MGGIHDDWVVAIPTFDRLDTIEKRTLRLLALSVPSDRVYVFVDPRQFDAYNQRLAGRGVHVLCGERSVCEQRNAIMRRFPPGARVVEMDDDIERFEVTKAPMHHTSGSSLVPMPDAGLRDLIDHLWKIADHHGCSSWGIYPVRNPFMMSHSYTIGLAKCTAQFQGYINPADRLRLSVPIMEDYERCLLMFSSGQRLLRANYVAARTRNYGAGGCQSTYTQMSPPQVTCDGTMLFYHPRAAREEKAAADLRRRFTELVTGFLPPKPHLKSVPLHGQVMYHPPGWRLNFNLRHSFRKTASDIRGDFAALLGLGPLVPNQAPSDGGGVLSSAEPFRGIDPVLDSLGLPQGASNAEPHLGGEEEDGITSGVSAGERESDEEDESGVGIGYLMLSRLKVSELRQLCRNSGVDHTGVKAVLVSRLLCREVEEERKRRNAGNDFIEHPESSESHTTVVACDSILRFDCRQSLSVPHPVRIKSRGRPSNIRANNYLRETQDLPAVSSHSLRLSIGTSPRSVEKKWQQAFEELEEREELPQLSNNQHVYDMRPSAYERVVPSSSCNEDGDTEPICKRHRTLHTVEVIEIVDYDETKTEGDKSNPTAQCLDRNENHVRENSKACAVMATAEPLVPPLRSSLLASEHLLTGASFVRCRTLHPDPRDVLASWRCDPSWHPPQEQQREAQPSPQNGLRISGSGETGLAFGAPTIQTAFESFNLFASPRGASGAFVHEPGDVAPGSLPDEHCIFWALVEGMAEVFTQEGDQSEWVLFLWDAKAEDSLFDCGRAALGVFCDPLTVSVVHEEDCDTLDGIEKVLSARGERARYPSWAVASYDGCRAVGLAAGRERRNRAVWLSLAVTLALRRGDVETLDVGLRLACARAKQPEDEVPNMRALAAVAARAALTAKVAEERSFSAT